MDPFRRIFFERPDLIEVFAKADSAKAYKWEGIICTGCSFMVRYWCARPSQIKEIKFTQQGAYHVVITGATCLTGVYTLDNLNQWIDYLIAEKAKEDAKTPFQRLYERHINLSDHITRYETGDKRCVVTLPTTSADNYHIKYRRTSTWVYLTSYLTSYFFHHVNFIEGQITMKYVPYEGLPSRHHKVIHVTRKENGKSFTETVLTLKEFVDYTKRVVPV